MTEIIVNNPYTGEEIGRVPRGGAADIDRAAAEAEEGAREMRSLPLFRRAAILAEQPAA